MNYSMWIKNKIKSEIKVRKTTPGFYFAYDVVYIHIANYQFYYANLLS